MWSCGFMDIIFVEDNAKWYIQWDAIGLESRLVRCSMSADSYCFWFLYLYSPSEASLLDSPYFYNTIHFNTVTKTKNIDFASENCLDCACGIKYTYLARGPTRIGKSSFIWRWLYIADQDRQNVGDIFRNGVGRRCAWVSYDYKIVSAVKFTVWQSIPLFR